jgi:hypothetical protein
MFSGESRSRLRFFASHCGRRGAQFHSGCTVYGAGANRRLEIPVFLDSSLIQSDDPVQLYCYRKGGM